MDNDEYKCRCCGVKTEGNLHPCPFHQEMATVPSDYTEEQWCNCCEKCELNCAMDI